MKKKTKVLKLDNRGSLAFVTKEEKDNKYLFKIEIETDNLLEITQGEVSFLEVTNEFESEEKITKYFDTISINDVEDIIDFLIVQISQEQLNDRQHNNNLN